MAEIDLGVNKAQQFKNTLEQGVDNALQQYGRGDSYFTVKKALDKDIDLNDLNEEDEEEMDEQTMTGGSSGAYEMPFPGKSPGPRTKTKKTKSGIPNWEIPTPINEAKKKCGKGEYWCSTDKVCKPESQRKNKEEEMGEQTGASSSGAYSQPAIWAKNKKNWRAVSDPNFPKWGGPGGTYVKVKKKCSTFPYCNQGDINALDFYESTQLMESIMRVAKNKNRPTSYVLNIVKEAMKDSNLGRRLKAKSDKKSADSEKKNKRYSKGELDEIIRGAFYKSPVTDPEAGIVGVAPMNLPIGKMYSFKGNKPKYEQ
jgi:hypothetical protein